MDDLSPVIRCPGPTGSSGSKKTAIKQPMQALMRALKEDRRVNAIAKSMLNPVSRRMPLVFHLNG